MHTEFGSSHYVNEPDMQEIWNLSKNFRSSNLETDKKFKVINISGERAIGWKQKQRKQQRMQWRILHEHVGYATKGPISVVVHLLGNEG